MPDLGITRAVALDSENRTFFGSNAEHGPEERAIL